MDKNTGILIILFFSLFIHSVTASTYTLSMEGPDSQKFLNGELLTAPVKTEDSYTLFSQGRMSLSCDMSGNIITKKLIKGKVTDFNTTYHGFTLCITDKYKLNLINPSLSVSWQGKASFDITQKPVISPEGRIYVRGKNAIECWGINGIKKWKKNIITPASSDLIILNDSSLIYECPPDKNRGSIYKRLNCSGSEISDIVFEKKVRWIFSTKEGLLTVFEDGSVNLYTVFPDYVKAKWVNPSIQTGVKNAFYIREKGLMALVTEGNGGATVTFIQNKDGKTKAVSQNNSLNPSKILEISETSDGIFISDDRLCLEINTSGKTVWSADLPSHKLWNYITYTDNGTVLLFLNDWFINTYRIRTIKPPLKKNSLNVIRPAYFDNEEVLEKEDILLMKKAFTDENIGEKEEEYITLLTRQAQQYMSIFTSEVGNTRAKSSIYTDNPVYTEEVISLMGMTGTTVFNNFFSTMLRAECNRDNIYSLVKGAGLLKYDIDGDILDGIQEAVEKSISFDDTSLLCTVCDTTYEICAFMGKESVNKKGKEIITKMFFPQYNKKIKEYAQKTMGRLAQLDL